MAYTKTTWANDTTPLSEGNMNKIESGIENITALSNFPTATGAGTAILVAALHFALAAGESVTFIASAANSGAATTLNVNSLGAKSIYKPGGTVAPNIISGKAYTVWYNGTNFFVKASAEGTAAAADVLAGTSFSNDSDTGISGSMTDRGTVNIMPSTVNQSISGGKHSGAGVVYGDPDLVGGNIVTGNTIFGVPGSAVGASGDAVVADVLSGKTFSKSGAAGLTGTMTNNGSVGTQNLTTEGAEYAIAAGYHNGLGKVKAVITNIAAAVIKAGVTVGGIAGTFTADATAAAGDILSGITAYVNGAKITGTLALTGDAVVANVLSGKTFYKDNAKSKLTGTMTNKVGSGSTITPSTGNQNIPEGYYGGAAGDGTVLAVTSAIDSDIVDTNIKYGVTILGVAGSSYIRNTSIAANGATVMVNAAQMYVDQGCWQNGVYFTGTMMR